MHLFRASIDLQLLKSRSEVRIFDELSFVRDLLVIQDHSDCICMSGGDFLFAYLVPTFPRIEREARPGSILLVLARKVVKDN